MDIPESNAIVVPNGIPDKYFSAFEVNRGEQAKSVFELSVVGKVIPVKRVEVAIEALRSELPRRSRKCSTKQAPKEVE